MALTMHRLFWISAGQTNALIVSDRRSDNGWRSCFSGFTSPVNISIINKIKLWLSSVNIIENRYLIHNRYPNNMVYFG